MHCDNFYFILYWCMLTYCAMAHEFTSNIAFLFSFISCGKSSFFFHSRGKSCLFQDFCAINYLHFFNIKKLGQFLSASIVCFISLSPKSRIWNVILVLILSFISIVVYYNYNMKWREYHLSALTSKSIRMHIIDKDAYKSFTSEFSFLCFV